MNQFSINLVWESGDVSETVFGTYYIRRKIDSWIVEFKDKDHEYYKRTIYNSTSKDEAYKNCQEHFQKQILKLLNTQTQDHLTTEC